MVAPKKKNSGNKRTVGKNGRQKPELQSNEKFPKRKKHKKLKHDNDRNPYRFVWVSLIFLFISISLAYSEISYLKFWKEDVSIISMPLGSIFDEGIKNSCGQIGVIVSDLLTRRIFGISAVLIPLIFFMSALACANIPKVRVKKYIYPLVLLTCVSSVILGSFEGRNIEWFGSGLGGETGIYISEWLNKYIGQEGTQILLVIFLIILIWCFFAELCLKTLSSLLGIIRFTSSKLKINRYHSPAISVTEFTPSVQEEPVSAEEKENIIESINNPVIDDIEGNAQIPYENSFDNEPLLETVIMDNGRLGAKITDDYIIYFCAELLPKKEIAKAKTQEKADTEEDIFIVKQPTQIEKENPDTGTETETENTETEAEQPGTETEQPEIETENTETEAEQPEIEAEQPEIETEQPEIETENSMTEAEQLGTGTDTIPKDMFIATEPTTDENSNRIKIDDLIISKIESENEVSDDDVNERKLYDPTLELSYYKKPTIDLLTKYDESNNLVSEAEVVKNKEQIVNTLGTFGISISEIEATVGPTVTLYEIKPAPGVRISKIQNLEKDIALALAALGIRIIAPIPGKGAIGIEVPNKKKATVSMYSVIKSEKFHESTAELPIALGRTIQNETLVLDLAKMPHLLVAGMTGQGKSVGLNAIITSLLYKKHPAELKFIMVDPKRLELTPYASLAKHFMAQMEGSDDIILTDTNKVVYTLNSICREMDDRYKLLEDAGVRNLKEYNTKFIHRKLNPEKGHRFLPYLVVVIDEFADLIMTAGREVETPIARIAQLARAAGIHMIIATQRPTANIITGTIKANFPSRIAFKVASNLDSRTILDKAGAEQLIGRGDMLVHNGLGLTRVQCAFVDTPEVEAITKFIGEQQGYYEPYKLPEYQPDDSNGNSSSDVFDHQSGGSFDPLLVEVARYVVDNQLGSTSKIQRNFEIGFNRAGRIVDQLEKIGIVGKQQGSKPRQVLISDPVYLEHILENFR